jgi:hypothetical protein
MAANCVRRTYGYEARTHLQVVREVHCDNKKEMPAVTHEHVAAGLGELYSVLSACAGSMDAARRAGMIAAMPAATARITTAKIMTDMFALVIS